MGAITQIRALGGVVGIAIATNLFNTHLRDAFATSGVLSPNILPALLHSPYAIAQLPAATQETAREVFAGGYAMQMKTMVAFAVVQVLSVLGMWKWRGKVEMGA